MKVGAKTAAVVNPHAAAGRTGAVWRRLEPIFKETVGEFSFLETQRPGHATQLVRQALRDGFDRIVSVGGDGTHHEVINGFFDGVSLINPEAVLAILPIGTGSDLARTLHLPRGPGAIPLIAGGGTVRADVGRVRFTLQDGREDIRHFINVAHAGAGGAVAVRVNRGPKKWGGFLSFLWGVITTLAAYENKLLRLTIDGTQWSQVCNDVIIANGQYDGGGMHVAPDARIDSGHFEVYVIGDVGRLEAFANLPRIYRGTLMGRPDKVQHFQATQIALTSDQRVLINLDGEQTGQLPATFDILPHALNIVQRRSELHSDHPKTT